MAQADLNASICVEYYIPNFGIADLKAGESIDDFLDGFPTVTKEQVIALIESQA